jgi:hypothetical protein
MDKVQKPRNSECRFLLLCLLFDPKYGGDMFLQIKKLRGLNLRANYTDRATAA